jgi:hypothetical protein
MSGNTSPVREPVAGSSYFNEFVVFGIDCGKTFEVKDILQNDGSTGHGTKEKV